MNTATTQLDATDEGMLTLRDERGRTLLAGCSARVHLSNNAYFALEGMECTVRTSKHRTIVEAGGDNILARLRWEISLLDRWHARFTLQVTNTTPDVLPVERLDVLISKNGYRDIAPSELYIRRTGWQSFGTAAVREPFEKYDPWLQPPLHMPGLLPAAAEEQQLPWMTVLQSDKQPPLLLGFGGAKDYMGMIHVQPGATGHRIAAANYVEGVELQPGETFTSEPFIVAWGKPEQELLGVYADFVARHMQARVPAEVATGWSTWFYYFTEVTEKDVIQNADIIKKKKLPVEYIQVDDGYQTQFGDWLSIDSKKFPHGMKHVADHIRKAGYKPGIWLTPFMANANSEVFQKHPDWFLRDARGQLINVNRRGDVYWHEPNYGLDVTHPEAYTWLKKVITTICKEWGYEYLKIDYMYSGAVRAERYDRNCTSVQAYRRGLELIRSIAGDRYILGCGAPLLCSVGLVDGMRISGDLLWSKRPFDSTLPRSRDPLLSLFSHMWMNKKLWINDPDFIHVRQHKDGIPWPQAQALTALIAMGGGALYDSDNLATLEPEGYELLERTLPAANITSVPVLKTAGRPSRLCATVQRGETTWHIAAQFNWEDQPLPVRFLSKQWELPTARYHVYDLLNKQYVGLGMYRRLREIPPLSAGLYTLCPAASHPQVVATEGHLLGPAGDIETTAWDGKTLTVRLKPGRSTPAKLLVHCPVGFRIRDVSGGTRVDSQGAVYAIQADGMECKIHFKMPNG